MLCFMFLNTAVKHACVKTFLFCDYFKIKMVLFREKGVKGLEIEHFMFAYIIYLEVE